MTTTSKAPSTSSPLAPTTVAPKPVNWLNKAIDPPCIRFDCVNQARCADEKLACWAFVHYVETGHVIPPRTLFVNAQPVMSNGRFVRCTRTSTTAANYHAVFPD